MADRVIVPVSPPVSGPFDVTDEGRLGHRALRGAGWIAGGSWLNRLFLVAVTLVLGKTLAPRDFGVYGVVTLLSGALIVFNDLGFADAVVVLKDRSAEAARTAYTVSLVVGVLMALLIVVTAPLVADFFRVPDADNVIRMYGLLVFFKAASQAPRGLLTRSLDFRRRFVPDAVPGVIGGVVTILLALRGWGIWSLVIGDAVRGVSEYLSCLLVLRDPLVPGWDPGLARQMWAYGRGETTSGFLEFGLQNVDYLIIGLILGPVALGYYAFAFRLAILPMLVVTLVVGGIVFPVAARIADDKAKIGELLRISIRIVTAGVCLLGLGLTALAPNIQVLGEKWRPSVTTAALLGVYVCFRSLAHSLTPIMRGMNRPGINARLWLLWVVLLGGALLIFSRHGVVAAAWSQVGVALAMSVICAVCARRFVGVAVGAYLTDGLRAGVAGVFGIAVVVALRHTDALSSPTSLRNFVVLGVAFVAAYCGALAVVDRHLLRDLRDLRTRF
jgi:PST family polysaccharide transporter